MEITTQKGSHPSRDWLGFVKSSRARNKIKHWINANEKANAIELGKRLLEKESRRFHVSWKKVPAEELLKTAHAFGLPKADDLYSSVGFGQISARQVLARIFPDSVQEEPDRGKVADQNIPKSAGHLQGRSPGSQGFRQHAGLPFQML